MLSKDLNFNFISNCGKKGNGFLNSMNINRTYVSSKIISCSWLLIWPMTQVIIIYVKLLLCYNQKKSEPEEAIISDQYSIIS